MIYTPKYPPRSLCIEKAGAIKMLLTENTKAITRLEAKIDAQTDRSDFIEDCMAELAIQAYQ